MEVVGREKLEAVAVMKPSPTPRQEARCNPGSNGHRQLDR